MNTTRPRFWSLHASRGWLLILAAAVLLATLFFGPFREQAPMEVWMALAILAGMLVLAVAASGRLAFGIVAGCLPMLLLVIAANIKFQYLSTPVLAPDLIYYFNAEIAKTLLEYPLIIAAIAITLILVPLLLVVLWRGQGSRATPAMRWTRLAAASAALVALAIVLAPRGPFADVYAKGMWDAMNDESFISDFVVSIPGSHISEPAFNPADATRTDWRDLAPGVQAAALKPDIIAVLEESTFDPRMLVDCKSPLCDAKMFHADDHTIATGWLDVHTWGGGTWTSEFAFLTGLPHLLFGPAGVYAPFNLAPRIRYTLPKLLDADGYRTVGIYPTGSDFMNGRDAYADYGFNVFYGGEQLGIDWDSTDSDVFKALQKVIAIERPKAHGKPLFVFVLTLYQHGPHMSPLADNPAPYNQPLFTGKLAPKDHTLDGWLNLNLTNYLSRLASSDTGMSQLESYLQKAGRPALLLHFGDHQPSFGGAINVMPKQVPAAAGDPQYVTYYMLKGYNLPIRRADYPVIDIAYLASLLLDAGDLPRDAFFTANTLLRDRCAGQDYDCKKAALRASYRAWVFGKLGDLQ